MNMPQILKTKCIVNFRKHRSGKKFRFGGVKMGKSNEIEELVVGHQEAKRVWNVLSPSCKDRSL